MTAVSGAGSGLVLLAGAAGDELDAYDISPGLLGFVVTFVVVVALILLLVNMTSRLRRLKRRAEPGAQRSDQADGGAGRPGG
ncbi:MAG TPA: hypothetical protein PKB06_03685 [Actinotalea sp.]|nr:hypothetical protein [Actinotalea sp.]